MGSLPLTFSAFMSDTWLCSALYFSAIPDGSQVALRAVARLIGLNATRRADARTAVYRSIPFALGPGGLCVFHPHRRWAHINGLWDQSRGPSSVLPAEHLRTLVLRRSKDVFETRSACIPH